MFLSFFVPTSSLLCLYKKTLSTQDELEYSRAVPLVCSVEEAQMQEQDVQSAIDPTKFKTKMCRNWAQGSECPYGDRCVFAHGEVDKRKAGEIVLVQPNMNVNLVRKIASSQYTEQYYQPSAYAYETSEFEQSINYSVNDASFVSTTEDSSMIMTPTTTSLTPNQTPDTKSLFVPQYIADDRSSSPMSASVSMSVSSSSHFRYEPYGGELVSQVVVPSVSTNSEVVSYDSCSDNGASINTISDTEQ